MMLTYSSRDVSRRCCEAWESLPDHLHYKPSYWDTSLPISVKLMLTISYLAYLYNEFLVQKLLVQEDCLFAKPALLNVSLAIRSTVLTLGKQQERSIDIRRDLNWTV